MKHLADNLKKLISILNDQHYHSGSALGEALGISRSAVWKFIAQLESHGVVVRSIKGKGYCLSEPLYLLDEKKIRASRQSERLSRVPIDIFASLPSTNDYCRALPAMDKQEFHFCLAEEQTAGRGRLRRGWYSPFASNIYLSCLTHFEKDLSELAGLSLVVSIAIVKALEQFGVKKDCKIKWPNDVLIDGKKLAGNLIEVQAESNGLARVIIGIGLNVNMKRDDERKIEKLWTSLGAILGKTLDRNQIVACLIDSLHHTLMRFQAAGLDAFLQDWAHYDYLAGMTVTIEHQKKHSVMGKALGINAQGHLLLHLPDGTTGAYASGDTSVTKY